MNNFVNILNLINELEKKTTLKEIQWKEHGGCYQTFFQGDIYLIASKEEDEIMVIVTDIPSLSILSDRITFNATHIVFWKTVKQLYQHVKLKAMKEDTNGHN